MIVHYNTYSFTVKISDLPTQNVIVTEYFKIFPLAQLRFLPTEFDQLWQQSVNIGSMRNNILSQLGEKKSTKLSY